MELLDTNSCHGTVPMEPPMSNSSMHHRELKSEIDDTGHFLQGASCTIAAPWGVLYIRTTHKFVGFDSKTIGVCMLIFFNTC
jgi:hypothetical protein